MTRVGLFGGAFDPPHLAHVLAISALLNSSQVDEVWVVPTGQKREKSLIASAEHRLKMIELTMETYFADDRRVKLDLAQISEEVPSVTITIFDHYKKKYPKFQFAWVIGSELIEQLTTWVEADRLLRENKFLVLPRSSHPLPEKLPPNLTAVQNIAWFPSALSSTHIRELLKTGQSVAGLIPPPVLNYISKHHLYR